MVEDMDRAAPPSRRSAIRVRVSAFGVAVLALGMLLWARFLIITNYQRTAYAEPAAQASDAPAKPARPAAQADHAAAPTP